MRPLARHSHLGRLEGLLGPETRLRLRHVLRDVRKRLGALGAVLAVESEVVDFVGELELLPQRIKPIHRVAPSLDEAKLRDGTVAEVVTAQARIGRTWPRLTLLVVEPADRRFEDVADVMEGATEQLEDVLIPLAG